jgi:AcrR family transcriptional regulator
MSRKPDADLESRILDAAYKLWSKRGEKALTMRGVAKAAGTTTPTMYQRFRDKSDLMMLLHSRALEALGICFAAGLLAGRDVRAIPGFRIDAPTRVPASHGRLGRAAIAPGTEADI